MTPLYAGIVRVSQMGTRKTGTDTFHADAEQTRAIEQYVAALEGTVDLLPPELSVSGGKPITERPSLQAAIEGVESGKYAGIVAAYLSRLTRSRSGLEIWDRVEAAGGTVHAAAESLDTSTPNGRFIRDIHLANAVREREEKGEQWRARRTAAVASGVWMAARTPYGYTKGADRRLTPNADALNVTAAFHARAAGTSISELARTLELPTNVVRWILRNRVYLGELSSGENIKPNPNAHPALIDRATFAACQTSQPRPPRSKLDPALLGGIVRCASCGYVMARRTSGSTAVTVSYSCPASSKNVPCAAPAGIRAAKLDAWIEQEFARPTYAEMLAQGHRENADKEHAALETAQAELDAWITNVSASSPSYTQGLAAREAAVAQAETAHAEKLATLPSRQVTGPYDELSPTARNAWLRSWLGAVYVGRMRGTGRGPSRTPTHERVTGVVAVDGTVLHGHREPIARMLAA